MTGKLFSCTIIAVFARTNYQKVVHEVYKNVHWSYSDQNFLNNVGRLHSDTLWRVDRNDGGFWRISERQFNETKNVKEFDKYYDMIKESGVDWSRMEYSNLKDDYYSALAMMLLVQKKIELENIIIGWGGHQCIFLKRYIQLDGSITAEDCQDKLTSYDEFEEYYQEFIFSGKEIQMRFQLNGDLADLVMGVDLNIKSDTHEFLAGVAVDHNCDGIRLNPTPGDFDVLWKKGITKIHYSPKWNASDECRVATCQEDWKFQKKTLCVAIWKLGANDEAENDSPMIRVSTRQLAIPSDFGSTLSSCRRKSVRIGKSSTRICDIDDINEKDFNNVLEKTTENENSTTCLINPEDDVTCQNGHKLSDYDCSFVKCGGIEAATIGIIVPAVIIFVLLILALVLYFVKFRKSQPQDATLTPGRPKTNKDEDYLNYT